MSHLRFSVLLTFFFLKLLYLALSTGVEQVENHRDKSPIDSET